MKGHGVHVLVSIVVTVLLVTACAEPQQLSLGEEDAGRTVEIGTEEQFTVQLPSNATTGFGWIIAKTGPVKQVGESTYDAPQNTGVVGEGGVQTFRFRAEDPGSGELKLEYRRPWEKGVAAEKTWQVTITVR